MSLRLQESWLVSEPDRCFNLAREPDHGEMEPIHDCLDCRDGHGFGLVVSAGRYGTFWCEDLIL